MVVVLCCPFLYGKPYVLRYGLDDHIINHVFDDTPKKSFLITQHYYKASFSSYSTPFRNVEDHSYTSPIQNILIRMLKYDTVYYGVVHVIGPGVIKGCDS